MSEESTITTGDGTTLAYRLDGSAGAPVLVLSNSIATTHAMWERVVPSLAEHFRVVRYDTRGHGGSDAPSGPYSFDRLGHDVLELIDSLGIERAHFCGLSLGGFIGQWLGAHAPDRLNRLVLANTSPHLGPRSHWDAQITKVLSGDDLSETAESFLDNWFPANLRGTESVVGPFRKAITSMCPQGLAGCYAAIRDGDLRRTNALIANPTLVITGEHDEVCLPTHGEQIADAIPAAELVSLPVVHLSNVEQPHEFVRLLQAFLTR